MAELSKSEIINIISTSKKYNTSDFIYEYDITYIIGERKYKISIDDCWNRINLRHYSYHNNIKRIDVSISKRNIDSKKVLAKFREVVRNIIKMDGFLKIKDDSIIKITPVIEDFLRKEYSLTGIISVIPTITFPSTSYYTRGRSRSGNFDVSKETPENLKFDVSASFVDGKFQCDLNFKYLPTSKKLILEKKDESFTNFSKDITKIIRSEKLKNLIIKNEEATD